MLDNNLDPVNTINSILSRFKFMLRIGYVNTESQKNCIEEFKLLMNVCNFDIFGVSKALFKTNTSAIHYALPNYKVLRNYRTNKKCDDIIVLYHKRQLSRRLELLYVQIKICGLLFTVCVFYIPSTPSLTELNEFEQYLCDIVTHHENFLIMSDFNVNVLNNLSSSCTLYNHILETFGLQYLEFVPTRQTSLVDHFNLCKAYKS